MVDFYRRNYCRFLTEVDEFVQDFGTCLSRKQAISAFFEPLLTYDGAKIVSSNGALILAILLKFKERNFGDEAAYLMKLTEQLSTDGEILRFLLLCEKVGEEKSEIDNYENVYPGLSDLPTIPPLYSAKKVSFKSVVDSENADKCTEKESSSSGVDLEESPSDFDILLPISIPFNDTLIAINPGKMHLQVSFSELGKCLRSLIFGHESWLFYFDKTKLKFSMKDGVFLHELSHICLSSRLKPIIRHLYNLATLDDLCKKHQNRDISLPKRSFLLALSLILTENRDNLSGIIEKSAKFSTLSCKMKLLAKQMTLLSDFISKINLDEISDNFLIDSLIAFHDDICMFNRPKNIAKNLIFAVFQQLLSSIDRYLSKGTIDSPTDSFFARNFKKSENDNYSIKLVTSNLIGENIAKKITDIGKLRKVANNWTSFTTEYKMKNDRNIVNYDKNGDIPATTENKSSIMEYFDSDLTMRLQKCIVEKAEMTMQDQHLKACLNEILLTFRHTLQIFRRVFLQKDPILAASFSKLMIGSFLDDSTDWNSPMKFNNLLDSVFDSNLERKIAERFTFVTEKTCPFLASVDNVILSYDLPYPLNLFIPAGTVDRTYSRIWNLLTKFAITQRQLISLNYGLFEGENGKQLILCHFAMKSFITGIYSYIWQQLVHVIWHDFEEPFLATKSFERCLILHRNYVNVMLKRCFLSPKSKSAAIVLNSCLGMVGRFCSAIQNGNKLAAMREKTTFDKRALLFVQTIRQLVNIDYDFWLQDLLIKLDMNDFYKRQEIC